MKVAVHATGDVGRRAGLILLNGTGLEQLGLVDADPRRDADVRVQRADDFAPYDAVVTDAADPTPIVARAARAGVPVATWVDWTGEVSPPPAVIRGANMATGIATSLGEHEAARCGEVMHRRVAWTEPGRPMRRGEPVPFPDPVGARWGRRLSVADDAVTRVAVPLDSKWAAVYAEVTCAGSDGVTTRVVGVADLASHLEAIALAAGGVEAVGASPGVIWPDAIAERYLSRCLEMGLAVATFVDGTPRRT